MDTVSSHDDTLSKDVKMEESCVLEVKIEEEQKRLIKGQGKGVESMMKGEVFLRADQIDLKNMDEQLERHMSRAWTMEKKAPRRPKEELEIDPRKLVVKDVIARGTYGTVHRGVYDGQDVAGASLATPDLKYLQTTLNGGQAQVPNNAYCVVVEYLACGTLKSNLIKHRRRKLAFKVMVQISLDLARRLNYIHSKKIVHKDVKIKNMFVEKSGTIKIADFGVARIEAQNRKDMMGETGTLGYMAPENLRPEIPRCCPSSSGNVMKMCWDANLDKRPEMDEVVKMLEAIDTSKGGGMIPVDESHGCFFCFRKYRGP